MKRILLIGFCLWLAVAGAWAATNAISTLPTVSSVGAGDRFLLDAWNGTSFATRQIVSSNLFASLTAGMGSAGVWVVENGSDATGQRGNMGCPFATLEQAEGAAQEGDVIYVAPGTYAPPVGDVAVTWLLMPGVVIAGDWSVSARVTVGGQAVLHGNLLVSGAADAYVQCGLLTGSVILSGYTNTLDLELTSSATNEWFIVNGTNRPVVWLRDCRAAYVTTNGFVHGTLRQ